MEEGRAILKVKSEFFHTENGLVASTDPGWKQLMFDTLIGIFDRVGIQKNARKTVGVVCRSFQAAVLQAYKSYTRRMTG